MKLLLLTTVLLLSAAAISLGQARAKDRDPWDGFGVGSQAIIRERTVKDGEVRFEVEKTLILASTQSEGGRLLRDERLFEGRQVGGRANTASGRSFREMGLRLESTKDSILKIGQRDVSVTVRRWIDGKEPTEIDAIRREFPDFSDPRPAGHANRSKLDLEIVSYEARSPDLAIPSHEIDHAEQIVIGPQIVKTEIRFIRRSFEGEVEKEWQHGVTARLERKNLEFKGKKVECVVFDEQSKYNDTRRKRFVAFTGEAWHSSAVPGHLVRRSRQVEATEGKGTHVEELVDFEVQPVAIEIDLPKAITDRPTAPDPARAGLRLGGWMIESMEKYKAYSMEREASVTAHRLMRITGKDRYILQTTNLGEKGWETPHNELIVVKPPEPHDFQPSGKEEITVLKEKVRCEVRKRKEPAIDRVETEWIPLDAKWKELLAKVGLPAIKWLRTDGDHGIWVGDLVSTQQTQLVGDRRIPCVHWQDTYGSIDGPFRIDDSYYSPEVPGRRVFFRHETQHTIKTEQILDFGESERPIPDAKLARRLADRAHEAILEHLRTREHFPKVPEGPKKTP